MSWKICVFLYAVIFLNTKWASCEPAVATMLQLRNSVNFSYPIFNKFLDLIRHENPSPIFLETTLKILSSEDKRVRFRTILPVLKDTIGYSICFVFGLLFTILLPLFGLIFLCARCCGKCGGRVQLMDAKKDPCRRVVYAICLVLIVTFQLLAMVLVLLNFVLINEAVVHSSIELSAPKQLNSSLTGVVSSIRKMLQVAGDSSFDSLDKQWLKPILFDEVDRLVLAVTTAPDFQSISVHITEIGLALSNLLNGTQDRQKLNNMTTYIENVRPNLSSFQDTVINPIVNICPSELVECNSFRDKLNGLLDFLQSVPNASDLLATVDRSSSTINELKNFNDTVGRKIVTLNKSLDTYLDEMQQNFKNSNVRAQFSAYIETMMLDIQNSVDSFRKSLGLDNQDFSHYREERWHNLIFYVIIGLFCCSLFILLLYYFGLCFGVCGARPLDEAGGCNRGVGANLLLAGVVFTILFCWLLMLICTVLFLFGGVAQTEICRYLTGHTVNGTHLMDRHLYNQLQLFRDHVALELNRQKLAGQQNPVYMSFKDTTHLNTSLDVLRLQPLEGVLIHCEHKTFGDAMRLDNVNLEPVEQLIGLGISKLSQTLNNSVLVNQIQQELNNLIKSQDQLKTFDPTRIQEWIEWASNVSLNSSIAQINDIRNLNMSQVDPHLNNLVGMIQQLEEHRLAVIPILRGLKDAASHSVELRHKLEQYEANVPTIFHDRLNASLSRLTPVLKPKLATWLIDQLGSISCSSLHKSAKLGVDAVCVTALMPLNAIWGGLGFALLLFVVDIVFAVKLAGVYRKTERYPSVDQGTDYISFRPFYAAPYGGQYASNAQKPRDKRQKQKSKSNSEKRNKRQSSTLSAGSNSRYQQVSVYPYDAYE